MKITVLLGGWSSEREVSLVSGAACAEALTRLGHEVTRFDPPRDPEAIAKALRAQKPDVVFNALHGEGGEDGVMQALLDLLELRYTHSPRLASTIAMDKPLTKSVLATHGVRSPEGKVISVAQLADGHPLPRPYVVKPAAEGSSVGVSIVREGDNTLPSNDGWTDDTVLLAERFIAGRELTVGVLDGEALAVTEIVFGTELFDYTAKYVAGHASHVLPAAIPASVATLAMRWAATAHKVLGCAGATRSDFRWDERQGDDGLFFLEINTQPGMTPISLVPEQAQHRGRSFDELVGWMVEDACRA
ncbi:MAG: D-alanine--D-alanine ligase [Rhodospirillales bacterium]|jgi:D-alanine-D-alanine ligase|nr:D-alanine--D-alanine ligase [Rhodospirillales bacterium]